VSVAQAAEPQLFIVSGPSGSGKTTVVEHLLKDVPDLLFSISCTTRAPRAGEQNGREYHFVGKDEFEAMLVQDELLEHAAIFGEYYGTPRRNLEEARRRGRDLLLDIDVLGARQVKGKLPESVAVLLVPPSAQELERRLTARAQDRPEVIRRRLERAREELEHYHSYDYLVINRELEETCRSLSSIVAAERARRSGAPPEAEASARMEAARKDNNKTRISAILESFGARTR
jgi:guanylate kinase